MQQDSPDPFYTGSATLSVADNGYQATASSSSYTYTLTRSYNHYNGRGDVVAKTDQAGALTWTGSYEAFGTRTRETGTNDDRQRANTKDEDPTGLLNEGHRYRDLETGTWLSRDPAGFVDGPNLYAYVRCNPWSKFDAQGLFEVYPHQPIHEIITGKAYANSLGAKNQSEFNAMRASNPSVAAASGALTSGVRSPDLGKVTGSTGIKAGAGFIFGGLGGAALGAGIDRWQQLRGLHFGDQQWQHSMSSTEKTAQELTSKIKDGLTAKFNSALQAQKEGKTAQAYSLMGELAHTIEDAYSASHVTRDDSGKATGFSSYPKQDDKKHAGADHVDGASLKSKMRAVDIDDYDSIQGKPGVKDATDAMTNVFSAFAKGDKAGFKQQLDKTYDHTSGATVGESGGYEPTPKPDRNPNPDGAKDDGKELPY